MAPERRLDAAAGEGVVGGLDLGLRLGVPLLGPGLGGDRQSERRFRVVERLRSGHEGCGRAVPGRVPPSELGDGWRDRPRCKAGGDQGRRPGHHGLRETPGRGPPADGVELVRPSVEIGRPLRWAELEQAGDVLAQADRVGEASLSRRRDHPLAGRGRAVEWGRLAYEHPERERADAPRVGGGPWIPGATDHLRRSPAVRADATRHVVGGDRPGDAEVDEDRPAVRGDPHVRRLDIAVDDALWRDVAPDLVEVAHRVSDLADPPEPGPRTGGRDRVVEVFSRHPFRDRVDDAEVADVRLLVGEQRRSDERLDLPQEVGVLDTGEHGNAVSDPAVVVERNGREHLERDRLAGLLPGCREHQPLATRDRAFELADRDFDAIAPMVTPGAGPARRQCSSTEAAQHARRRPPAPARGSTGSLRLSTPSVTTARPSSPDPTSRHDGGKPTPKCARNGAPSVVRSAPRRAHSE